MSKLYILLLLVVLGDALQCYTCFSEHWCKKKHLKKAECEDNVSDSHSLLRIHYEMPYNESFSKSDFECFSIDSTTRSSLQTENRLVYKGCIEKGYNVCDLKTYPMYNETKKNCKVCSTDLCNKNGSAGVGAGSFAIIVGVASFVALRSF